jgi:hypothetical protein
MVPFVTEEVYVGLHPELPKGDANCRVTVFQLAAFPNAPEADEVRNRGEPLRNALARRSVGDTPRTKEMARPALESGVP